VDLVGPGRPFLIVRFDRPGTIPTFSPWLIWHCLDTKIGRARGGGNRDGNYPEFIFAIFENIKTKSNSLKLINTTRFYCGGDGWVWHLF